MKVVLIYFSQTGNTKKIARAIQKGVMQITGQCDLLKIKDANPRRLFNYDLISIGAPTHHGREPANVTVFIKKMRFVGGKQCFVFSTHGTLPSNFFARIIPVLKNRGLKVIGYNDWYANATAAHGYGHHLTDGHPDEIDLQEAEDFGREMVLRSVRISAGNEDLIPEVPKIDSRFVPTREFMEFSHQFSKAVEYKKEKCLYPVCRLCMDNCPMDGIDLTVSPPMIANPCMGCQGFCEAICPTGALIDTSRNYNPEEHERIMRETKHPDMAEVLRKAEAEGRFRRLISEEEAIERSRQCLQIDRHPRWIIGKGHG